jgi:hypothetical protein
MFTSFPIHSVGIVVVFDFSLFFFEGSFTSLFMTQLQFEFSYQTRVVVLLGTILSFLLYENGKRRVSSPSLVLIVLAPTQQTQVKRRKTKRLNFILFYGQAYAQLMKVST